MLQHPNLYTIFFLLLKGFSLSFLTTQTYHLFSPFLTSPPYKGIGTRYLGIYSAYTCIAHYDAARAGKFAVDLYFRDVISHYVSIVRVNITSPRILLITQ